MTCVEVRRHLLDGCDQTVQARQTVPADEHLAHCPAFAAQQSTLHRLLGAALVPPDLPPGFRTTMRARLALPASVGLDAIPDVLHLGGCGLLTAAFAYIVPAEASLIAAAGVVATATSDVVLAAVRNAWDESAL